jgi:tRNA threonylcarbamoyl adenosine modification protein YeaZ
METVCRALAIETSGRLGSVALVQGTTALVEQSFSHGLKHAAGLLPMVDEMVSSRGWKATDLQHIYISQGPGSFTGLRIGVTLAKTLSMATGARIVPVPSLHVLAHNAPSDATNVIIVLDAKRDQIFTGRFERVGQDWVERERAHLDSLEQILARSPRPVFMIGEGIPYHEKFLPPERDGIIVTPEDSWHARASVVARLGTELAAKGLFVDADRFTPAYIRIPEAEERYRPPPS